MSETPLIPEWLAHDPSLTPGALSRSRTVRGRVRLDAFEDSLYDAPTLPPMDDEDPPEARSARPIHAEASFLPAPRRVDDTSPDEWVLVSMGVGLTASMLALLMMLISGYGAV